MTVLKALFTPVQLGPLSLKHRVVMAPLTRSRSTQPGDVPNDLMAEYYGQRASDGGFIFLQLWQTGRAAHTDMTGGVPPVAPSAIPFEGISSTPNGWLPTTPPRALNIEEIPLIVEDYRRAAERAKAAGFDGVELHAANGYLIDQFLQDGTNKRTDAYGGSIEDRSRFLLEVVAAITSVWDANRIGVRIAPNGKYNSISDSNPSALFSYVAEQLNRFGLAYLHIVEPRIKGSELLTEENQKPIAAMQLRKIFKSKIIDAGGFEPDTAEEIVEAGDADLVAFGRHFISNPDLPERIQLNLPLNPYNRDTFYTFDARGYTDYPSLEDLVHA